MSNFTSGQILTASQLTAAFAEKVDAAFTQSGAGAVARTVQSKLRDYSVTVEDFGAVGDGATDDYPAFAAAIASGAKLIRVGAKTYRLSAGVTVPDGVAIAGASMTPGSVPGGSVLMFDNAVPTCVQLTTGSLKTACVRNLVVYRAGGTPPAGSYGILAYKGYNVIMENVFSFNHARLFGFYAQTVAGLGADLINCYGALASESYFYLDSWPEFRCTSGRFGSNSASEYVGDSFIYVTGTSSPSLGVGPNTFYFMNVQFNQGLTGPNYWIHFNGLSNAASSFNFIGCHVENNVLAYIKVDGTNSYYPRRFRVTNCTFNGTNPMFDLPAGMTMTEWGFANNQISASTFSPNVAYMNGLSLVGNIFSGTAAVLNAPAAANWSAAFSGNVWGSGSSCSVQGSGWAEGTFFDSFSFDSTFSDISGSSKVQWFHPTQSMRTWTPGISFGNASVGVTYASQIGYYQIIGREVRCWFVMTLTSKGTSTGVARLTGLPFQPLSSAAVSGVGANYVTGAASLTGAVITSPSAGGTTAALYQAAASGITATADTNYTNTTSICGQFSYLI